MLMKLKQKKRKITWDKKINYNIHPTHTPQEEYPSDTCVPARFPCKRS